MDSCIHCLSTEDGRMVPRPLGHAMHSTKPNLVIHFDYFFMEQGENGYKYVLIVNDDLSGYVFLNPTIA